MVEIKHEDGRKGIFEIFDDAQRVGEMTYTWAGDNKFIIDHTEVFEGHEGKGYAKQLVEAGIAFARARQVKIMPLCPYAKRVFDKATDLDDIKF